MIELSIQYKIPFKNGDVPRLNQRVQTPHGVGKIIGQDIPVGYLGQIRKTVRYYVLMDKPAPEHKELVNNSTFNGKLCYWADELETIKRSKA
jgi:hypothetical protein